MNDSAPRKPLGKLSLKRGEDPAAAAPKIEAPAQERTPVLAGFDEADPSTWGNPGRNDACPCGSGEKFKHCHGRLV